MPQTPTRRPVILTAAANYGRATLEPFVRSWKKHVGDAELVVFATQLDSATIRWLEEQGATIVPVSMNRFAGGHGWRLALYHKVCSWGVMSLTSILRRFDRSDVGCGQPLREAASHLATQRYFYARRHLQTFGHRYSDVLLIDCRDAVFQRSPFPCTGLQTYAENELIGRSHFGKRWLQLTYGTREWHAQADLPFLCSGVTIGDLTSIERYLDVLCAEALRTVPCTVGLDQALHNYVIHRRLVPATINPFGSGAVINLNGTAMDALEVRAGRVYSRDGQLFAIVHQYDRVPGLQLAP